MNEDGTIEHVEIEEEKITMPSNDGYYMKSMLYGTTERDHLYCM